MNHLRCLCFLLLTTAVVVPAFGQLVDNTSTFKEVDRNSYFRFHYDNDFFTKSDENYTQGITMEYVKTGLKGNPINKILLKPANSNIRYGISLNLFGYTPTSILIKGIQYGDRPYEASISVNSFLMGSDTVKKERIASSLNLGIIGPAAFGNEIQTGIHRWLDNPLPLGWHNQIRNDVIINYQLNYEKLIFQPGEHFLANFAAEGRIGTLNDRVSAGANFMTGNYNDPYASSSRRKKAISYYFFGQARAHLIGYEATMQGGVFNRKSVYTIAAGDINRVTFQADAGIVVNFRKLFLAYTQSYLTKEFRSGGYHRWGGFNIGFAL